MYKVFEDVANFLKIKEIHISNHVFGLHYKVTVVMLIAFSLLGTQKQYFGDPIDCIASDDAEKKLGDTYCWIHSTYTVRGLKKHEEIAPGVGKPSKDQEKYFVAYYQWVPLFLFFQVCIHCFIQFQ